jgi:hypothetical protein
VDREQLRATQAPLKAQYRDDPARAFITLRADGTLGEEDVSCSVATGRAMVEAGLHPATGGDGGLACSGDMLLQALVACAGVTLRSVAINRGLTVGGSIRAEGDLDFRGTLAVERDAPSASPPFACTSISIPRPRPRKWPISSPRLSVTASCCRRWQGPRGSRLALKLDRPRDGRPSPSVGCHRRRKRCP